jgi:hypothetical protein
MIFNAPVVIIVLILTVAAIINSIICQRNFGKGLKIYCKYKKNIYIYIYFSSFYKIYN